MAKLRVATKYATIPVDILNDQSISLKAKGLYAYIQSKPDGWAFSAERISSQTKEGRDSIRVALVELENAKLLQRVPVREEKTNKIVEYDYVLYDRPYEEAVDGFSVGGFPVGGFSVGGKSGPISNIDSSKIDVVKNPLTPLQGESEEEEEYQEEVITLESLNQPKDEDLPLPKLMRVWRETRPDYLIVPKNDYPAARKIFLLLAGKEPTSASAQEMDTIWRRFLAAVGSHPFYKDKSLKTVYNHIQDIIPIYREIEKTGRIDVVGIRKENGRTILATTSGEVNKIDIVKDNKEVKIRMKGWMEEHGI